MELQTKEDLYEYFRSQFSSEEELRKAVFGPRTSMALPPSGQFRVIEVDYGFYDILKKGEVSFYALITPDGSFENLDYLYANFLYRPEDEIEFFPHHLDFFDQSHAIIDG